MRNKTGSVVRESDFQGREGELSEIWDLLERGNVLLLGPRRVGKTSLLFRMQDVPWLGWRCVYFSVEDIDSEAKFVARLLAAAWKLAAESTPASPTGRRLQQILIDLGTSGPSRIEVTLSKPEATSWEEVGRTALELLANLPQRTALLVDEFPVFVVRLLGAENGPARAQAFLSWLRAVRLSPTFSRGLRLVLTGSIGLDSVLRRAGLSATINDLSTYWLGPLSPELADQLLKQLEEGEGVALPVGWRAKALARIGWLAPFNLQLLFLQLRREVRGKGDLTADQLVESACQLLLAAENRQYFLHWGERLREAFLTGEEYSFARDLLRAAALHPEGVSLRTVAQLRQRHKLEESETQILATLEHDGYLVSEGDHFRFASPLLRDWWRKWQLSPEDQAADEPSRPLAVQG